jgi:sporulation protein YlmC with PRC-barrel domain
MLKNIKPFLGRPLKVLDGVAGSVEDFLFDTETWAIRYLVAETGRWFRSRQVVIPALVLGSTGRNHSFVFAELTAEEVDRSPVLSETQTVSGRYRLALEKRLVPRVWIPEALYGSADILPPQLDAVLISEAESGNLRSVRELIGYRVTGMDGEVGRVTDLVVDDATWVLRRLVVRRSFWPLARTGAISSECIEGLSWAHQEVRAGVTCGTVKWRPVPIRFV